MAKFDWIRIYNSRDEGSHSGESTWVLRFGNGSVVRHYSYDNSGESNLATESMVYVPTYYQDLEDDEV